MARLLFAALCLLCASVPFTHAIQDDEPTFYKIGLQKARGQWALSFDVGDSTRPGEWTPLKCPTPVYGACFNETAPAPFNAPLKVLGTGQIRFKFNFTAAALTMYNVSNQIPKTIETKICYSNEAFNDRPWRKKNKPYPRLSQNCIYKVKDVPFPDVPNLAKLTPEDKKAMSGSVIFNMTQPDEMPTGTYFFMLWLRCSDGTVCAFESSESPSNPQPNTTLIYSQPYNGIYFETEVYNAVTPGMTAAAIVLSIFGPVFFVAYYIADAMHYSRTGKPLSW